MEPPSHNPLPESADGNGRRAMNSTAYRIYKLLQWLIETPLSVSDLNKRFCNDPLIGKSVSTDSIWLYINTLKTLGCRIRRPSPKNQFCYELISHPFGLYLIEQHFEILSQAKAYAQQHFNHQEVLTLDRLLKKIVSQGNSQSAPEAIERLFNKSRSYDYADSEAHLRQLHEALHQGYLLQLTYASPLRGKEILIFLPERIFYEQGVVYVRGERTGQSDPSNLRLERILSIETLSNDHQQQTLLQKRTDKKWIHLQLTISENLFEGFGLSDNQGVYKEQIDWQENPPFCTVRVQVRETFYLKQKLLASEHPFQVVEPLAFREDLQKTLEAMSRLYEPKES